jgi:hypothetical protein
LDLLILLFAFAFCIFLMARRNELSFKDIQLFIFIIYLCYYFSCSFGWTFWPC